MKKYLVIATVLVALVALFSFSASAASISLDANVAVTADAAGAAINRVSINLDGAAAPVGGNYYTVLAYTGNEDPAQAEILFAGQEVAPIAGFSVAPTKLAAPLYVKFGGSGLDAVDCSATYAFAIVAFNEDDKALAAETYTQSGEALVVADAAYFHLYGAEIKDEASEEFPELLPADASGEYAHRVFRQIVEL